VEKEFEKTKTFKFLLFGLWKSEEEIRKFLKKYDYSIDFISPFSFHKFLFNLHKYKNFQMIYFLRKISLIRNYFCQYVGRKDTSSPLFLIRVDDFPHWEKGNDEFKRFNEIMEEFEIFYLLGKSP